MATWKTVTVDDSGADYTTFEAAKDAEATDITAQVGDLIIQGQDGFIDANTRMNSDGSYTTDPTHRLIFQGQSSLTAVGWNASGTGVEFDTDTGGDGSLWTLPSGNCDDVVIRDLQFYFIYKGGFNNRYMLNTVSNPMALEVERCLFLYDESGSTGGGGYRLMNVDLGDSTAHIYRNVLFATNNADVNEAFDSGSSGQTVPLFENCTMDGFFGSAFGNGFTDAKLTNCRVTNSGALADDFTSASDYNLTDEASPPADFKGTNGVQGATLDYVDDSATALKDRDYALNSNTDDGWETGLDLSGTFPDDILGITRIVSWDIGCSENSLAITGSAADGVKLSDTGAMVGTFVPAVTDGVKVGDVGTMIATFPTVQSDGVDAGDSATVDIVKAVAGTEGIDFSDTVPAPLIRPHSTLVIRGP